jgi:hypothetical protein
VLKMALGRKIKLQFERVTRGKRFISVSEPVAFAIKSINSIREKLASDLLILHLKSGWQIQYRFNFCGDIDCRCQLCEELSIIWGSFAALDDVGKNIPSSYSRTRISNVQLRGSSSHEMTGVHKMDYPGYFGANLCPYIRNKYIWSLPPGHGSLSDGNLRGSWRHNWDGLTSSHLSKSNHPPFNVARFTGFEGSVVQKIQRGWTLNVKFPGNSDSFVSKDLSGEIACAQRDGIQMGSRSWSDSQSGWGSRMPRDRDIKCTRAKATQISRGALGSQCQVVRV